MDFKDITKSILNIATPQLLIDCVKNLSNMLEKSEQDKQALKLENDILKNKIKELQGLPVKPKFIQSKDKTSRLSNNKKNDNGSDDKNKRQNAAQKARLKNEDINIDKKELVKVDTSKLDKSYKYKGTRKVIVQDLNFSSNNIEFNIERYYSSKYRRYVEGKLPVGYDGRYGARIKVFILTQYYQGNVTIKRIKKILEAISIKISLKHINTILNDSKSCLANELEEARIAAIKKLNFQQIDDTGANLCFQNAYTTVTCNPYFTKLFTSFTKNRRNAIMALTGGDKTPLYKLNEQAIICSFISIKSLKIQKILEKYSSQKLYNEKELLSLFKNEDFQNLSILNKKNIKTAMLVGALYDGHLGPTGDLLISDDAPQFNNLLKDHLLCWVHELRHYVELSPVLKINKEKILFFMSEAQNLYYAFKHWITKRGTELQDYIFREFNRLFSKKTGYDLLDDRIKLSFNKMEQLLAPLYVSFSVPLDNNESERDIRCRVIKRKISLFNRTIKGAKAWDLYLSLMKTCQKNKINFYQYLLDRFTQNTKIPMLNHIIEMN